MSGTDEPSASEPTAEPSRHRVQHRTDSTVQPLELFFDLVFVLAVTQCTALMAAQPDWAGIGKGMLALAVLWWAWGAYAWLTSVIDPEQDATRLTVFAAMGAMLVVSLCVPQAFGDLALTFAIAYAAVRAIQIVLFVLASPDDPELRRSVMGLAVSSTIGVGLLVAASFVDGWVQAALWALAIVFDTGGPFLFGSAGWHLVPSHFAERHGLIVIIALGESIVAIGLGAEHVAIDAPVIAVAVLGVFLAAALWWLYFDVIALAGERRLASMSPGQAQNALARDMYSYIHLLIVAGIVLVALGLKTTIAHVSDPLHVEIAAALSGGAALYLLAHVAFRSRLSWHRRRVMAHIINRERLAVAIVLLVFIPFATLIPAWVALLCVTGALWALVAYETRAWSETRHLVRHENWVPPGSLDED